MQLAPTRPALRTRSAPPAAPPQGAPELVRGDVARLRHLPVRFRLLDDEAGPGSFECVASVYDLEYSIGWGWREVLVPGVFAESLAAHPEIPIFWQHRWDQAPIGDGIAEERDKDLVVRGQLYIEDPTVARIHAAMKAKAVREWSIGFYPEIIETSSDDPMLDKVTKGDLAEVSSVVRGANPETETVDLRRRPPVAEPPVDLGRAWELMRSNHGRDLLRSAVV